MPSKMVLALCAAIALGGTLGEVRSGVNLADLDPAIRPQDDLFRHVNGRWLTSTDIPGEKVSYDTFSQLGDKVEADLRAIIEELAATPNKRDGSPAQQIGDLYASLMDEARIEALGTAPIRPRANGAPAACARPTRWCSSPTRATSPSPGRKPRAGWKRRCRGPSTW